MLIAVKTSAHRRETAPCVALAGQETGLVPYPVSSSSLRLFSTISCRGRTRNARAIPAPSIFGLFQHCERRAVAIPREYATFPGLSTDSYGCVPCGQASYIRVSLTTFSITVGCSFAIQVTSSEYSLSVPQLVCSYRLDTRHH